MLTTPSIHEEITQRVIESIEDDQCPPWRKPWQPHMENSGFPSNIFSMPFTGIAVLVLNMAAGEQKLNSRFWSTRAGWEGFGGVVSGHGTLVPNRRDPTRWVRVFNADRVSGGEAWRFQSRRRTTSLIADYTQAEAVIAASRADIRHKVGQEAAYYYQEDYVIFPEKWQFEKGPGGVVAFWDSLFHEVCGHWTETRLGFEAPSIVCELRAEMAAPMLASQLGIPVLIDMRKLTNHRKHLGRWIAAMKDDPTLIFNVAASASEAVEYLLSLTEVAVA